MTVNFTVSAQEAGLRLDQLLAVRVPGLSRRRARVLIDLGGVFVDRRRVEIASRLMQPDEVVVAHLSGALSRAENRVGEGARAAGMQAILIDPLWKWDDKDCERIRGIHDLLDVLP